MPKETEATEVAKLFVLEFDYRSDDGDRIVGPFTSQEGAQEYVDQARDAWKAEADREWSAEYSIVSLAAATDAAEAADDTEMPPDELDDGEEVTSLVPVHGVSTIEGRATGDGRGFRAGAADIEAVPQPLGFEFESGHGSDNSKVAIVGQITEMSRVPVPGEDGVFEIRWRGMIDMTRPYAGLAVQGIADGTYTGASVIVDSVTVDVSEQREELRARILRDQASDQVDDNLPHKMSTQEIEDLVDTLVGDGTQQVQWYSEMRQRRLDMVPTGAFIEAYVGLGWEFADEMTPDQLVASAQALTDCGCGDMSILQELDEAGSWAVVDLTELSEEEREEYDGLAPAQQEEFAREHGALVASANFAPGTHDGPGWITHPLATARIRRYWVRGKGAAKIRWGVPGDFNRCRLQLAKYVQNPDWLAGLCANMHKEALGIWPGMEDGGRGRRHSLVASAAAPQPLFSITASAAPLSADYFANPNFTQAEGIHVEGDKITGYIAVWNVCHIGNPQGPGRCTLAPRSNANYAWYRTGKVLTDEGYVPVGQITMATGHAGQFLSARDAVEHYDNTGYAIADVACGEDAYGIWFSGKVRPGVSDEDIFEVMASGIVSGDWREIPGVGYELVAGLVVNVGGFGIPNVALAASAAGVTSIVAAGMYQPETQVTSDEEPVQFTAAEVAGLIESTVETFIARQTRAKMVEELAPIRAQFRARQLADARSKFISIER